ncbi:VPS10 domain-containing protein [Ochrovirga pacifica]|uniref:VPS10 domain-containing protein n=1 Tax=Ochrovirga pacifica TaxID=1042376 RepID=UPI00025583D8|nr:T9SS type A sorting domain-containing protein [Ochrovirga pacifica]
MKSIVHFLLLLFLPNVGWSQTVVFQSGFENSLTSEWDVATSGTGLSVFEINSASKKEGNYGFQLKFSASDQKGNLWTPKNLEWKIGKTYKISFYYKALDALDNQQTNIKVFDGNGNKVGHFNLNLNASEWTQQSVSFTPSQNSTHGQVLFSFRPNNANVGEVFVDEVMVIESEDLSGYFERLKTENVASVDTLTWVQFGPGMSGNNKIFYPHPTDANTHYISPNMGNSYRSTDKGFTYQTVMGPDAPSYKTGLRGPVSFYSLDFSRQNENFGLATGSVKGGLYTTADKGKTWSRVESAQNKVGANFLSVVSVDPTDENVWYLGAGRMRHYGRILYPQAQPKGAYLDPNANGRLWKSTDKGQTWTLSNSGIDARAEFSHILVDPNQSNVVYAGTNYGFYKSTDGGATWSLKSNGIDHDMILSMDMHVDEDTQQVTLFVLSNITWKAQTTAQGNTVTHDKGGVFKSTDGGESWTAINGDVFIDLSKFNHDNDIKKSYYQTVAYYFGLNSWTDAEAAYPVLPTKICSRFNTITVDPSDVNNLYLVNEYSNASDNNFKPGQIWRSTNGGAHWFVTFRNGKNWNNGRDDAYWVTTRNNPMGTNVTLKYKSDWKNRDGYERKGCNYVKFSADGAVLYTQLAKIGLVSYDKGNTWVDIDDEEANESGSALDGWVGAGNSNVPGHGFYQSELWPGKVFCPSGENSLWITNNEGEKVRPNAQGAEVMHIVYNSNGIRLEHSVSAIAIHPTEKNTWFVTLFRQAGRGKIYKTIDAGANWFEHGVAIPEPWAPAPPGSGDQAVHQVGLMIDKSNPDNMYFCVPKSSKDIEWVGDSAQSWGVHRSTDGGVTWQKINNGLPASLDVSRIAFDPNNTNTLYAAVMDNNGGLYKSTDRGENWSEVASTTAIAGASGINDIHFDVDGNAYITSGFKNVNVNQGGLWMSTDGMQTWTQLFDYPWVNRVEVAKYNTKVIMISTLPNSKVDFRNGGTYLSKNGGATWVKFNKGNGQSERVNDIAIDYTRPGTYYASTRGSGWYVAKEENPSATVISSDDIAIKTTSVTCPDNSDGDIEITTNKTFEYSAVLSGNGITETTKNFTDAIEFSNLEAGTYSLCIAPKDRDRRCYEVKITEPKKIAVTSSVNKTNHSVLLELKGSDTYSIQLNNQRITVSEEFVELPLQSGLNTVTVKGAKDCQGEFFDEIMLRELGIHPNPTSGILNVYGLKLGDTVKVFNAQGVQVLNGNNYNNQIDLSELTNGMYILSIQNELHSNTQKIIKK